MIAAFWGLESDFGANMGNLPTLRSLVSLAYDCRRSEMFANETIAALKVIDRGDLGPDEMVGSWAGELGQTQFLPTHYFNYAVDYDGDGRRNLLRSPEDVIGSTANYIANGLKWRRGEPWLQEVRAPQESTVGSGRSDDPAAAFEMGAARRHLSRRQAAAERRTAVVAAAADGPDGAGVPGLSEFRRLYRVEQLADLFNHGGLSRHPHRRRRPMRRPSGPMVQLPFNEIKELQRLLVRAGFNVGKVDGVLGQQSRIAVKAMQVKYGLPADSWPTAELLARMRGAPVGHQPSIVPHASDGDDARGRSVLALFGNASRNI